MTAKKTDFININNTRLEDQKEVMEAIGEAALCPFCLENLRKYHKQPILKEGKYWILTKNQWPYEHSKEHFLLIYRQHACRLQDLDPAAGEELFRFLAELEKDWQLPGGALAMRFGDTDYSAGSVNHLHAQLIVPDIEQADFQPVRVKIGLQWEKRQK
ncbi:hypothetical protein SDC9_148015 [bioreactor metagenome]|jgi:diadenosine tetraphosphate (Ap4A) HIT family hydrolase|uniref:HIT domain-containing protein n=1 Tax=bioreactor metagenome TaxID=1076179 RepID=A0A645EGE1_9ZZZZ